jgi:hypothetical protein
MQCIILEMKHGPYNVLFGNETRAIYVSTNNYSSLFVV